MRHPFAGAVRVETEATTQEASAEPTRRGALGRMVFATAGLLGLNEAANGQIAITEAVNEAGRATTLAIGEEGGPLTAALNEAGLKATTEPFGEEAGNVTSRYTPGLEDGARPAPGATRKQGE